MADFYIKQNDLSPGLEAQLQDEDGDPVSLSDAASVDFHMMQYGESTLKVNSAATISNVAQGIVVYEWSSGDTDTSGIFKAEFEVTYNSGKTETFPNTGDFSVNIQPQVG